MISPDGVKIVFRSGLDDLSIKKEALQDRTDYSASPAMLLHGGTKKTDTKIGGDKGIRTPGLLHAKQALSQLSYTPTNN